MDDSFNVKIADFGLAGITTPFSGNLRQLCGTPEFTAPEIVQGKEYSGPAVDIWSLGVILYELLLVSFVTVVYEFGTFHVHKTSFGLHLQHYQALSCKFPHCYLLSRGGLCPCSHSLLLGSIRSALWH